MLQSSSLLPCKDKMQQLLQLGSMAIHASNEEDPYVTVKDDEEDDDSEVENHAILPSDNLIAVGHVEGEAAILEVYGGYSALFVMFQDIYLILLACSLDPIWRLASQWAGLLIVFTALGHLSAQNVFSLGIDYLT